MTQPHPKSRTLFTATATVQAGTESISTLGAVANWGGAPRYLSVIRRSRYGSARGRDCIHGHPQRPLPPPAASDNPAIVGDSPRWVTSISGTNNLGRDERPRGDPAHRITDGSPRAARYVPRGSSPTRPARQGRDTDRPGHAGTATAGPGRRTAAAPRPARSPSASRMRRRSKGRSGQRVSGRRPARRRICGRGSATSGRTDEHGDADEHPAPAECSVTAPEASGPTTDGTTQLAANAAMIAGRNRSG